MLTSENYFSPEMARAYMSASQYKAFAACEAAAMAEIRGEYTRPETAALLAGSYVDAYFEGTRDSFREAHPQLFKRDGALRAEYARAEDIAKRLERDDLFRLMLSGSKQVIKTGHIAGVPFKIKIDSLLDSAGVAEIIQRFPDTANEFGFCDGAIVDLKVMRGMEPVYSEPEGYYLPFARYWGYDLQGAIYQAVEGNMLPFFLAVGTKEDPPDLAVLHIPDGDLSDRLAEVEESAPKYQAIKEGKLEPSACGRCPYCRSKKKLTRIYTGLGLV